VRNSAADKLAFVGLGSNLGEPLARIEQALQHLAAIDGVRLKCVSSCYRTPAWGVREQPEFTNAVAAVEFSGGLLDLMLDLMRVERGMGRNRHSRWAARLIDLDILLCGSVCITSPDLIVPHPWLSVRAFALVPLLEVAPDAHIPGVGSAAAALSGLDAREIVKL